MIYRTIDSRDQDEVLYEQTDISGVSIENLNTKSVISTFEFSIA